MRNFNRLCKLAIVLMTLCVTCTAAYANSVTYNVTGSFQNNGPSINGWVNWSSSQGAMGYSLSLSNLGTAQCGYSCSGGIWHVLLTGNGPAFLWGSLNGPSGSWLSLLGPGFQFSNTTLCWSTVSVPEGSAWLQLLLVLAVLTTALLGAKVRAQVSA
jgi:hypothetical protein